MKKIIQQSRFMLLLVAMMTLSLTNVWGTSTYRKITSTADFTSGYYVVTASSSASNNAYALGSTVNDKKRALGVAVTITNGTITDPSMDIIYMITKTNNGYSFKNVSTGKYLYQAATTSGQGMGFKSSETNLTLDGYNASSPTGFMFTLDGSSNNVFKWNNGSKWFANYGTGYTTSMTPVELFKLATKTAITLKANEHGTADGAVQYTNGNTTPEATPTWVSPASSDWTLIGYYTAATGGVKVINADNSLNTAASDYVDADGKWKCADFTLTLYAQWQSASNPQITLSGTLEPFTYVAGQGPSAEQTIVLKGSNLTENVEVTAPEGYECRLEDETEYSSTLSLNADAVMEEDGVTIYVHLTEGLMSGTFNGKLIATSDGATDAEIAFQGSVTPAPLTSIAAFIEEAPTTARELAFTAESNAVITGRNNQTMYVQDASGKGICIYKYEGVPAWTVGNKIIGTIKGTYQLYNSMPELVLTSYSEASAETAGEVTPIVLTEFTADNFAANKCKLIKIEDVFFQSSSLSNNSVIVKNASETSFPVYNTFSLMTSKMLPLVEDAVDVTGVYIGGNSPSYRLAATAIDAGDAKMDVDPIGGDDEASAVGIAPGGNVTITPVSGFTTKVDDVTKTAITTVPVTEPTSITIAATRDFYTTKSVTYYYKVDESIKAVTVNQPAEGGTIAADPTSAAVGATVGLSYDAADHYTFGTFTVMAGETPVTVDENEGVYSFTMPNADVTVTATFNLMAQDTAFFVGGEGATGTPDTIARYKDELTFQLPANQFSKTGFKFAGWSDGVVVKQPGEDYTLDGNKTFTATWNELSKWATTYTSNVTGIGTSNKVKIAGTDYNANKQNKGASTSVTVPAGSTELHFHALAWKDEAQTITVAGSLPFDIVADAGVSGSGATYTLTVDPSQVAYFSIALNNIEKDSVITFKAANNKRFVLFGVNAVQPAALAIDPTSYDFGSVKEDVSANKVFTITPNAFVEGNLSASFEGTDAAKFSASVSGNNVTVTFTPAEVRADMEATLKVSATNAFVTADLTGTGIAAATPEIIVPAEPVDFGKVKQDSAVADKQITVTLNNLDAATAAISGSTFTINTTALVSGENTITISANTAVMGEVADTITITGVGAETKKIAVKMDVLSKWADVYTSNIEDSIVGNQDVTVVIDQQNYFGVKINKGLSATVTVPKGTHTLHFHAAAWNGEAQTITVSSNAMAEAKQFEIVDESDISGTKTTYSFAGNNYSTDQYFHVALANVTEATDVTITAAASKRFVLYGVNQEGGIVPVLDSIKITGTAKTTTYELGESFSTAGLKVMAYYSLEGVAQTPVDVTKDADVYSTPATFISTETTSVTVTAEFEGKSDNKEVAVTVTEPQPTISVNPTSVNFGTIIVGAQVADKNVAVTLSNIEGSASVTLAGEGAAKFAVTPATLSASGDITISATADAIGTYAATITISATDATPVEIPVSMIVEAGDLCDQDDDFATVSAGAKDSLSYMARTTTDGWSAANTAVKKIDDDIFLMINGKTSAVGTITSPVFQHGISALKFRYANTLTETNGVKIKIDFVQNDVVVKSDTLEKAQTEVTKDVVYTETISNINIAGDYKIVFTNLSPSGSTSNKDRVSIGRICITEYADFARTGLTVGKYGTLCLPYAVTAGDYEGFEAFKAVETDGKNLTIESVVALEAGKAYIIVPSAESMICLYTGTAISNPVPADQNDGLTGTFTGTSFQGDGTQYVVANNKIMKAGNVTIGANKGWIILSEVPQAGQGAPQRPGSRRISLASAESQVATGLDGAYFFEQAGVKKVVINGQMMIIRDAKIFNAQGQMVK